MLEFIINQDKKETNVLEVGAATGGNLEMLAAYGDLFAMEMDEDSCQFAQNRNICDVKQGKLPDQFPFDINFDLICMLDVLEHIEDDLAAVHCLKNALTLTGKLVITVPAYQWLWSSHDVASHHYRRYTQKRLIALIRSAGLNVKYITYFNTFLFPIVAGVRLMNNFLGVKEGSDIAMPSKVVNILLSRTFLTERFFLPKISFPFGVSLLAVVEH